MREEGEAAAAMDLVYRKEGEGKGAGEGDGRGAVAMGSGAPTAGAEIQEKMVRENGEGGRRQKAAGEENGMEIDRELLSLQPPVDSTFRF